DARLDQELYVHAVAWNLIANDGEVQRLFRTFTKHRDVDGGALGTLQQVGDVAGRHVVRRLAVDRDNHVARTDAGFVAWRSGEEDDHDDFVVTRTHLHAYAVILAALFFAE